MIGRFKFRRGLDPMLTMINVVFLLLAFFIQGSFEEPEPSSFELPIASGESIDSLDPEHQIQTMEVFQQLAKEGRGVLISIHDLGLAARFCTRLILMDQGKILSNGHANEVLSDENLRDVFHVRAFRAESEGPILQPIGRLEN